MFRGLAHENYFRGLAHEKKFRGLAHEGSWASWQHMECLYGLALGRSLAYPLVFMGSLAMHVHLVNSTN